MSQVNVFFSRLFLLSQTMMQKSRWRRGVLHSRHARSSDGLSVTTLRQRRRRRRGAAWHPQGGPYGIQNLEPFDLKSCLSQTGQGFGASIRVQIAENELPIFYKKWSREAEIMHPALQMARKISKEGAFGPPVGLEIEGGFFSGFCLGEDPRFRFWVRSQNHRQNVLKSYRLRHFLVI